MADQNGIADPCHDIGGSSDRIVHGFHHQGYWRSTEILETTQALENRFAEKSNFYCLHEMSPKDLADLQEREVIRKLPQKKIHQGDRQSP